ncbi:hypothetical protein [Anaeromyxobacter dehalogenans]|uniref:hypothetical protein n=1 Tax=Anaeromyxobacter dehalogenans TaxID=161493 RepID=UPI0012EE60A0|nr:hypothetical protein [Anaeromyxobacter dehalogenans]
MRSALFWLGLVLMTGCGKKPEQVVAAYLDSPRWEDKARFVLDSERVAPLMERHYGDSGSQPNPNVRREVRPSGGTDVPVGEWTTVEVVWTGKNGFGVEVSDNAFYELQRTADGYRIDWEASVGYNPISWEELKAKRPSTAMVLRITGQLDDYYNYEFRGGREHFWSIRFQFADEQGWMHAYVDKRSEAGKKIFEYIKDGKYRYQMAVVARFLPGSEGENMVIDRLLATGWRMKDPAPSVLPPDAVPDGADLRARDLLRTLNDRCTEAARGPIWYRPSCEYSVAHNACEEEVLPAVVECLSGDVDLAQFAGCMIPQMERIGARLDDVCATAGTAQVATRRFGSQFAQAVKMSVEVCSRAAADPTCPSAQVEKACTAEAAKALRGCLSAKDGFAGCMLARVRSAAVGARALCGTGTKI